jgi:hypothetical protein
MIITEFIVDGSLSNGDYAIGDKLTYHGLCKDTGYWYYHFAVQGAPRYIYYFTSDFLLSTSEGNVKRYGQIYILKIPVNNSALFFVRGRDDPDDVYQGYLSSNGVKWRVIYKKFMHPAYLR